MKGIIKAILILMATVAAMTLTGLGAVGESDPFIDQVVYSRNAGEDVTVVQSGRDNATYYRYLILDDYADSPENWSQPNFNDSTWAIGAAPFGDRASDGVDQKTDSYN